MPLKILVAEDEEITLKHILYALRAEGYEAEGTGNGDIALRKLKAESHDLLIADIKMPGLSGMDLLERIKNEGLDTEVIIITGYGSIGSAVEAMKRGAHDYITKPFDLDELILRVKKIEGQKMLKTENSALKSLFGIDSGFTIIAESESMKGILRVIDTIRDSDCNVLLTGESGVGKNLIARLIHFTSGRKDRPFLSINCATLTEELLASELFGHEKGAFTGASGMKKGLVEVADRGTLFLDEIAEMTPSLQAKLLKVIEDGEFFRVGGTTQIRVDVRFIAATNQNVTRLIKDRLFREDLYYRLNVMEIYIPPLRKRKEDIEPLSRFFLKKHIPRYGKKITGFSDEALEILMNYSFPGNVRELENMIERAVILEQSHLITPESLPQTIKLFQIETLDPNNIKTVDQISREYVEKVLEMFGGNRTRAAEMLGISRTSLWRILKDRNRS